MPPRTALLHRTTYTYDRAVRLGPQWVRLRPLPDPRRAVAPYRLTIDPAPASLRWQVDPYGNHVARLVLAGPVEALRLEVSLDLDMTPGNPFDFLLDPEAEACPFVYAPEVASALALYLRPEAAGPLLRRLKERGAADVATVPFVLDLAGRVRDGVSYVVRMEAGVWTPEETLGRGEGSCRDSAWVLVQLLRLHGIAARFVSGYLVHEPVEGAPDGGELHAWVDAYLPGAGWIGLDATTGLLTAESHVALAASPEPEGAGPLSGTMESAGVRLETSIQLRRAA